MYAVRMIEKSKVDRAHRTFVSYIDRSREYYQAQGYDRPYAWAFFDDVPFAPVSKPLKESTLALITTASPFERQPETNDGIVAPKEVSSGASAAPPERLYTDDLSWDKETTHTEDLDSYFPIHRLQELVDTGRIGQLGSRYHGAPTEYSQRRTIEEDAPEILRRCREDGVDAALLVPL